METMKRVEKGKRKTRKVEDDIWWSGKGFLTHREKMLVGPNIQSTKKL